MWLRVAWGWLRGVLGVVWGRLGWSCLAEVDWAGLEWFGVVWGGVEWFGEVWGGLGLLGVLRGGLGLLGVVLGRLGL